METRPKILETQYSEKDDGYFENERSEMLQFIPANAQTFLEVGCGAGYFGEALKRGSSQREVWGIEPNEQSSTQAKERLDHVVLGELRAGMAELEGKSFDCIIFNDVLEHLTAPEQALLDCKEYLTEGGTVVASIPNILFFYQIYEILLEQDWKYRESGILDSTHLRFFTRKSILRMFASCGYEVVRIEGINPSFGLKYRAANLLTLGFLKDWKFVQFAVQARVARGQ